MSDKKNLDINSVVVQAQGLVTADMDGEKVMMVIEKGKYFGLDAIGTCIWELIQSPSTVKDLTDKLLEEFEIDRDTCQADVLEFLQKMHREGLVCIV